MVLFLMPSLSQSQMHIKINIDNQDDNIYFLLKYKSDKTHIVIDSTQSLIFKNQKKINEGIYVVANSRKQALFEILIGKDQKFSIDIEELMDYNSYNAKGSKETSSYFKILSKTIHNNLYIKALKSELEYNPDNIYKIDSIKKNLYEYQESMLLKDENSFLNTYIKFIEKIQNDDNEYIINHYFDDLPLCDVRILNSRLLKNKLDDYFNNYMYSQTSDIICDNIDSLLYKVADCKEVRDYILWYLYSRYFKPDNVEHEVVFVHMVDKYFAKLEISNLTENIRNQIIKRADVIRDITIGQMVPTLSYIDENGDAVSLDDIKCKNIILFFYKPDCQKCIKEKRLLESLQKKYDDLKVLSINISEENYTNAHQDIINQYDVMTTPKIYLLEDKVIIAKDIEVKDIEHHLIKR